MCMSNVQHMTGRKTSCNWSRLVFFWFFDFSTNLATGNWKISEFAQLRPVVQSFAVGFSSISVFFPVQQTGPANTRRAVGNSFNIGDSIYQYFTLPGLFHVESMEGGMDCRNSWWIPWNGGWNPWNGGWIPYFWWMESMESIGFPEGFHMEWVHGIIILHLYKFKPKYWVVWNVGKWLDLIT